MTEVAEILRQELKQHGPMPFARFMEAALYCPKTGYYEQANQTIGKTGDFFTSVSIGGLFGDLLAFQFAEWLEGLPAGSVQLVEAGTHDGQLARDILKWLAQNRPQLLDSIQYWIIEPSAHRQTWQRSHLDKFADRVRWFNSLSALPQTGITGIFFSNELLDAFPVHRLGWNAATRLWFEWGVTLQDENFIWTQLPEPTLDVEHELKSAGFEWLPELAAHLPDKFTIELSPAARAWWRQAALTLRQGKLFAIDYGLTADQFFAPERGQGTLRAYHQHRVSADLLAHPGEQDLTAHVNFTQLQLAGEAAGLRTEAFLSQEKFLASLAQKTWQNPSAFSEWTSNHVRQFQTLTHPEHLGRAFRVLIQSKCSR